MENDAAFPRDKFIKFTLKESHHDTNIPRTPLEKLFTLFPCIEEVGLWFLEDIQGIFAHIDPLHLKSLRKISLFQNKLTLSDIDALLKAPNLEVLYFYGLDQGE